MKKLKDKIALAAFGFVIFSIIGCKQKVLNVHIKQSLSWSDKNISVSEDGCSGTNCTFADFRYIVFSGNGSDSLNKHVNELMGSSFMSDSLIVTTPEASAKNFISAYLEYKSEFPSDSVRWMLDRELRPDTLLGDFISLRYDESNYTGGAHGNYFTMYSHFQLSPFKQLWLADFLSNSSDTLLLVKIGEAIFREKQKLGAFDDLEEAGYFFNQGQFRLNENFHFVQEGLEFHYNIYEIQPYALGEYKLLIPYSKISSLLKPQIFSNPKADS